MQGGLRRRGKVSCLARGEQGRCRNEKVRGGEGEPVGQICEGTGEDEGCCERYDDVDQCFFFFSTNSDFLSFICRLAEIKFLMSTQ